MYTSIEGEDQIIRYTCILFSHFAPKKNDSFLHIKAKYLKKICFIVCTVNFLFEYK